MSKINEILDTIFKLAVIGVLIYLLFSFNKMSNSLDSYTIKSDTVYQLDTIRDTKIIHKPVYKTKIETEIIPANVDTTSIIADYFSKVVYSDTVDFDTNGYIAVLDTISENQIISRRYDSHLILPKTIITNTVSNRSLYGGISVTTNKVPSNRGIKGELLYKPKKGNKVYGVGYGLNGDGSTSLTGKVLWKLRFKK